MASVSNVTRWASRLGLEPVLWIVEIIACKVCSCALSELSFWPAVDRQQRSNSSHWYHPGNQESCIIRGRTHGR